MIHTSTNILHRIVVLVLFACLSLGIQADTEMVFSHLGSRDGLSNGQVSCIFKDSRGYVWIGTGYGINRYDGYRVKSYYSDYTNPQSLKTDFIDNIQEDWQGRLWIQQGNEYCIYNPSTDNFDQAPEKLFSKYKIPAKINYVFIDDQKVFWVVIFDKGCYRLDPKTEELKFFSFGNARNQIHKGIISDITQYKRSIVLTYTDGSLVSLDRQGRWIQWQGWEYTSLVTSHSGCRTVYDNVGNMFMFTPSGFICHIANSHKRFTSLSSLLTFWGFTPSGDYIVKNIHQDRQGRYWIATDHQGLLLVDTRHHSFEQVMSDKGNIRSLSDNTLQCFFEDEAGRMWIGTYKNGINLWSENYQRVSNLPLGDVCTITLDSKGNYWNGTNDAGIICYNPSTGQQTTFNMQNSEMKSNVVVSSYTGSKDDLWFGTFGGGLIHIRDGQMTVMTKSNSQLANDNVWSIAGDKNGHLWLGLLGGGVQRLDPESGEMITFNTQNSQLISDYVASVDCDNDGNIIIGSSVCYSVLNTNNLTIENVQKPKSGNSHFSSMATTQTICDSRGLIWMGTTSGMNVYDPKTGNVYQPGLNEERIGRSAMSVAEDRNGVVWVSTEYGLAKVNVTRYKDQLEFNIISYDSQDGMQNGPFNQRCLFITKEGIVLVGGQDGIDVIRPQANQKCDIKPRVIFSGLFLYDKEVNIGEKYDKRVILNESLDERSKINLSEGDTDISILLASSDCDIQNKARFRYSIDGDKQWSTTHEGYPLIHLSSLSSGSYELQVQLIDDAGKPISEVRTIKISVQPPFYRSWWAMLIYAILILVAFLTWRHIVNMFRRLRREIDNMRNTLASRGKRQKIDVEIQDEEVISVDEQLVRKATKYVEDNLSNTDMSVETMAGAMNMSRVYLYKRILALTGKTPSEFIREIRMRHAEQLLSKSQLSVSEVSYRVGINSPRIFSKYFKEMYGCIPREYKKRKSETSDFKES